MSKSAYIKLVSGSKQKTISLEEVKQLLQYYQEMTEFTGKQLNWDYQAAAFPYEIKEKEHEEMKYLLLQGKNPNLYYYLMIGIGIKTEPHYVHIVLPSRSTHGDQAKANELSRFIAKQLQGELQMFNGRTMYFNKRK